MLGWPGLKVGRVSVRLTPPRLLREVSDENTRTRVAAKLRQLALTALAVRSWFLPVAQRLTPEAWQLFVIFAAAMFSVIINTFPLLTSTLLAGSAAALIHTLDPAEAFAGFVNVSVLVVVVAFLVAQKRSCL